VPCATADDCDDEDGCTDDTCSALDVCEHHDVTDCLVCRVDADCDDRDPCTSAVCSDEGSCRIDVMAGCVPCDDGDGCDDGDECTRDGCVQGVCAHAAIDGCVVCDPIAEICGDGIDNDCDQQVDCDDANCDGALRCMPAEVCGDCRDNDGDGLTDYEDADCCAGVSDLETTFLRLRLDGKDRSDRLRLKGTYAAGAGVDPQAGDTTLQLSDATGALFCATVEAGGWRARRGGYAFKDRRGTFADGLKDGHLTVKRDGVDFQTRGPVPDLRGPVGSDVRITVRVGDQCAHGTTALRADGYRYRGARQDD
jgi:hypothetical protein